MVAFRRARGSYWSVRRRSKTSGACPGSGRRRGAADSPWRVEGGASLASRVRVLSLRREVSRLWVKVATVDGGQPSHAAILPTRPAALVVVREPTSRVWRAPETWTLAVGGGVDLPDRRRMDTGGQVAPPRLPAGLILEVYSSRTALGADAVVDEPGDTGQHRGRPSKPRERGGSRATRPFPRPPPVPASPSGQAPSAWPALLPGDAERGEPPPFLTARLIADGTTSAGTRARPVRTALAPDAPAIATSPRIIRLHIWGRFGCASSRQAPGTTTCRDVTGSQRPRPPEQLPDVALTVFLGARDAWLLAGPVGRSCEVRPRSHRRRRVCSNSVRS